MVIPVICVLIMIYIIICFFLYWKQESFIFHPTKLDANYPFSQFSNFGEVYFPIENGKIHALHFKTANPKGVILYFHGNSQALESWGYVAEDFTKLGFQVFMPDYRTYGKSTGKLSEKALHKDALMVYHYLLEFWPASKIIIYGRSLGTGVGIELATKVKAKLLILETPYTSMSAMANKTIPIVPVKWLMKYQLRNITKMKKIQCPVHIFAGTADLLTPYQHAVALAKRPGNQEVVMTSLKGAGHGNIAEFPLYHEKLKELLSI